MSVRRSLIWTYLAQASSFLLTFASTVVVARLVSPRDFGIFAMVNAVITMMGVFMGFQLAKYVMREAELTLDFLRSVFTVNVIISTVYAACILVAGLSCLTFIGSPEVGHFLVVIAVFPVIAMIEFLPAALCAREMRFGFIAAMAMLRAVVMAITIIVLAYRGFGYMSFAWAQLLAWLATATCNNIRIWRPDAWRPRFRGVRSILHFGTQMIGISGVSQMSMRAGEMTLGSMLGLANLGLYNRASSLPTTLYANIFGAGSNVIFSRLSRELRETGEIHLTYIHFMRLILGLLWPMMFGLAVCAQPIIHILYGLRWQAAATPLALLTIAAAISVTVGLTSEVFILRHESRRQVKLETLRAAAGFLMFAGGAMISLKVAALAKVAEALLAFILYRTSLDRLVGDAPGKLQHVYLEGLLLTAAAILPALMLMIRMNWDPATPLSLMFGAIVLGVMCWTGLLFYRRHPIAIEAARALQRRF